MNRIAFFGRHLTTSAVNTWSFLREYFCTVNSILFDVKLFSRKLRGIGEPKYCVTLEVKSGLEISPDVAKVFKTSAVGMLQLCFICYSNKSVIFSW